MTADMTEETTEETRPEIVPWQSDLFKSNRWSGQRRSDKHLWSVHIRYYSRRDNPIQLGFRGKTYCHDQVSYGKHSANPGDNYYQHAIVCLKPK